MRCILYVHNHGERSNQRPPGRVCGMAVGEDPVAHRWDPDRAITSFVEFRCSAELEDPATEVQLAVGRAFARAGALVPGNTIELRTKSGSLRLGLEPGFDQPRTVLEPLLALARALCVKDGRVVSVTAP